MNTNSGILSVVVRFVAAFFDSFKTITTESFSEFANRLMSVERPRISICVHTIREEKKSWLCGICFISSLNNGDTIIFRREETVYVKDGDKPREKKYLANARLMSYHVSQPM